MYTAVVVALIQNLIKEYLVFGNVMPKQLL